MTPRFSFFRQTFSDTVPVLAGYLVLGTGFGLLLTDRGLAPVWAPAMSLFVYAGSMQYAAIGLLTGGASLLTVGLTTLMVNARHLFYGISMLDRYRDCGKARPYLIFALTDETYSLAVSEKTAVLPPEEKKRYFLLISLLNQLYWVTGSLLGGLLGSLLSLNTRGLDFSLTALFLTIFTDQWKTAADHLPAVAGLAVSVTALLLFGPDRFLIPAMCGITAALLFIRRRPEADESRTQKGGAV